MSSYQIAFFIGLFGSVHCVGMCGPLAFAVPSNHANKWWVLADKFTYNFGRIVTYTFLGLLFGILGHQLWLAGLQQVVSLLTGLLVILAGVSRLFKVGIAENKLLSKLLSPFYGLLSYAVRNKAGHFVIGLLNGFLPCGFVYLALAGAINSSTPVGASQYMFWFGFGTFPLMLIATVSSGLVGPLLRNRINNAMPYLMVCLGLWFVLRGLNLDIPYLSSAMNATGTLNCR